MSEDEKVKEYIADLEQQLIDIDLALIELNESEDPNTKVEIARLIVKKDDLLKQRAAATGEKYESSRNLFR